VRGASDRVVDNNPMISGRVAWVALSKAVDLAEAG
jgi:hypothetical protein